MKSNHQAVLKEFKDKFIEYRDDYRPHFAEYKYQERDEPNAAEDALDWIVAYGEKMKAEGREALLNEGTLDSYHGKLWSTAIQMCMEVPFTEVALQHLLTAVDKKAREEERAARNPSVEVKPATKRDYHVCYRSCKEQDPT